MPESPTVKFLVVRLSSIGDIVLTTPVVRGIKQQVPGAELHFLTKRQFEPILRANPYIDQLHLFDGDLPALADQLRLLHFDYLIDLHHNLRTWRLKRRPRILDFSFHKLNWEKWLLVHFKKDRLPDRHIVDRYRDTLRLFDVADDGQGLDFFLTDEDRVPLSDLGPGFEGGFLAVTVGAKFATKQMPVEKLAEILALLPFPTLLLGGPEDKPKARQILEALPSRTDIRDTCGQYGLRQSAYLAGQARAVLAHDTGLMHIAAALGRKIVSVWGNTVPKFGMYPYRPHPASRIFEVRGLGCRPCSKLGHASCPKGHFHCMARQPAAQIAAAVRRMMEQGES